MRSLFYRFVARMFVVKASVLHLDINIFREVAKVCDGKVCREGRVKHSDMNIFCEVVKVCCGKVCREGRVKHSDMNIFREVVKVCRPNASPLQDYTGLYGIIRDYILRYY